MIKNEHREDPSHTGAEEVTQYYEKISHMQGYRKNHEDSGELVPIYVKNDDI